MKVLQELQHLSGTLQYGKHTENRTFDGVFFKGISALRVRENVIITPHGTVGQGYGRRTKLMVTVGQGCTKNVPATAVLSRTHIGFPMIQEACKTHRTVEYQHETVGYGKHPGIQKTVPYKTQPPSLECRLHDER